MSQNSRSLSADVALLLGDLEIRWSCLQDLVRLLGNRATGKSIEKLCSLVAGFITPPGDDFEPLGWDRVECWSDRTVTVVVVRVPFSVLLAYGVEDDDGDELFVEVFPGPQGRIAAVRVLSQLDIGQDGAYTRTNTSKESLSFIQERASFLLPWITGEGEDGEEDLVVEGPAVAVSWTCLREVLDALPELEGGTTPDELTALISKEVWGRPLKTFEIWRHRERGVFALLSPAVFSTGHLQVSKLMVSVTMDDDGQLVADHAYPVSACGEEGEWAEAGSVEYLDGYLPSWTIVDAVERVQKLETWPMIGESEPDPEPAAGPATGATPADDLARSFPPDELTELIAGEVVEVRQGALILLASDILRCLAFVSDRDVRLQLKGRLSELLEIAGI